MKDGKFETQAEIDTLKQRELEYQSDLREKDRLINDKSNQIIEMTKEIQEKDERIKELERKIKSIDCYIAADEKCQQAVKDIEWLSQLREYNTYTELDKLYAIQTKYGLHKKEG